MQDLKSRQTDIDELTAMQRQKSFMAFKFVRPLIALIIVIGAFGFLFTLVHFTVPKDNQNLVALACGYILSVVSMVAAYYFGTSKDKSDAEQSLRTPNTKTQVTTTQETPEVK